MHTHSFAVTSDRTKKRQSISIAEYVRTRYPAPRKYPGPFGAIYKEIYWAFRQVAFWLRYDWQNNELEETDLYVVGRKPDTIDVLCDTTKFTRSELKSFYRNFKQEFPTGVINLERFKQIYSKFFFHRGSEISKYPDIIFNAFDVDKDGQIGFGELVTTLSILSRGTIKEKLEWIFYLYDYKQCGCITQDDLQTVVGSVFDILGKCGYPPFHNQTITGRVYDMQQKLKLNQETISKDEFILACSQDPMICESLTSTTFQ